MRKRLIKVINSGTCTVVEDIIPNPKIEGSNPASGTKIGKMITSSVNAVAEHSTPSHNIKGSNPAPGIEREKMMREDIVPK
jgi:hypothetical protein